MDFKNDRFKVGLGFQQPLDIVKVWEIENVCNQVFQTTLNVFDFFKIFTIILRLLGVQISRTKFKIFFFSSFQY